MIVPDGPARAGFLDPREMSTGTLLVVGLATLVFGTVALAWPGSTLVYFAVLWSSGVVAVKLRPDGGGQLVAVCAWVGSPERSTPNVSAGVLALELVALGLFVGGVAGIVGAGLGTGDHVRGYGGVFAVLAGWTVWTAAWMLEGLSVTASAPWRAD